MQAQNSHGNSGNIEKLFICNGFIIQAYKRTIRSKHAFGGQSDVSSHMRTFRSKHDCSGHSQRSEVQERILSR